MENQANIPDLDENLLLNIDSDLENHEKVNDLLDYDDGFLMDILEAPKPASEAKTNDMRSTDVSSFMDLHLKDGIIKSLTSRGYKHPSEIQSECIPQVLAGNDILAEAKSGTGKTLSFVLSTLHLLEPTQNGVQTLVICPTRELAYQTGKLYECFGTELSGVRVATFFGGLPVKNDVNLLRHNCPHIVVGTVGRILALIKFKALNVQRLKHFVVDECDQMLQLPNTKKQIREIYLNLPREKQVLMFSATLNPEMRMQCKIFMRNPIEIYIDDKGGLRMKGLVQHYLCVKQNDKFKKLVDVLDLLQYTQAIVFVNSVKRCRALENLLVKNKYSATGIHRSMKQNERIRRYEEVKKGNKKILVATNVFGRGMDIDGINTVINYDMPGSADCYLHGVARAGCFDTVGTAVSFVASDEDAKILNEVQSKFQVKIAKLTT